MLADIQALAMTSSGYFLVSVVISFIMQISESSKRMCTFSIYLCLSLFSSSTCLHLLVLSGIGWIGVIFLNDLLKHDVDSERHDGGVTEWADFQSFRTQLAQRVSTRYHHHRDVA